MRFGKLAASSIPLIGAIIAGGLLLTSRAALADDGDQKCSPKGQIWVQDVETRSWENTNGACTPRGPNGPANGDKTCGISGYTVKYIAKADLWQNTHTPCHGGATPGVHLENLHTGTEAGSPSGWVGDAVGAPGSGGM